MSCNFNWRYLPENIKEKLLINITSNWFKLPTEINKFLREEEVNNPSCYLQFFQPNEKVNWRNLLTKLGNVCDLLDCTYSILDITSEDWNWETPNLIVDETTFIAAITNGLMADATSVKIRSFSLVNGRLKAVFKAEGLTSLYFNGWKIKKVDTIYGFEGVVRIDLFQNQLTEFNPTSPLPSSLTALTFEYNNFTTAGYLASEAWAIAQPPFTGTCSITFNDNIDSITGTNLETILLTKNCIIIP